MGGYSMLILGPSGSGKSTLARTALQHEGSGVLLLAPGDDEANSYTELVGNDAYVIAPVDDAGWAPSMGLKEANGLKQAGELLTGVLAMPDVPRVLVVDTVSGIAQLAVNYTMARMRIVEAPAAMSPDGARYYTGIRNAMEDFMRLVRACRGRGMHVICISHVQEKEQAKTAMAGQVSATVHVPIIPGSYRELLPAVFDVVVHAGVNPAAPAGGLRYYVQWVPDPKRLTKSRVGDLGANQLPNDWKAIKHSIETALTKRTAGVQPAASA